MKIKIIILLLLVSITAYSQRSKSQQITFDFAQMAQDLGKDSTELTHYLRNELNLDYEFSGNEKVHKVYLHYIDYKSQATSDLFQFMAYITEFKNTKRSPDYTDLYVISDTLKTYSIEKNDTIYNNIKWENISDYNINELKFERELK